MLLMGWPLGARAQSTGTVAGRLLDAADGQPLPFAGVVLLRAQDSSFVAGAQTLETGAFSVEKVPFGNYVLKATVVGYRTGLRAVALSAAAPSWGRCACGWPPPSWAKWWCRASGPS